MAGKCWIPACTESTPPSTPLGYNNILGGIEQKSSGGNDAFLVAPAEAGVHASNQEWIPACAESTPRIEKKYSGGNDGAPRG